MAYPTILLNAGSGSDTLASGAGPATALTGTNATWSTNVVTLDGAPDLSGVLADGSHVIWISTTTGRRYYDITAVDDVAKTVTTSDNVAGTSGQAWAIGGTRATIDADTSGLFSDVKPGWTIQLEDNQSISSTIALGASGDGTDGAIVVRGDDAQRTITQTTDTQLISAGAFDAWRFEFLALENSAATKVNADGLYMAGSGDHFSFHKCRFGDSVNTLKRGIRRNISAIPAIIAQECEFAHCVDDGVDLTSGSETVMFIDCAFHHNGGAGVHLHYGYAASFAGCLAYANTGDGIELSGNWNAGFIGVSVIDCTIDGNANGISVASGSPEPALLVRNSNITRNATGISVVAGAINHGIYGCNFGTGATANTVEDVSAAFVGPIVGSLNVDPGYADSANGDFSPGVAIQSKALPVPPDTIGLGGTETDKDLGAAQAPPSTSTPGGESVLRSPIVEILEV